MSDDLTVSATATAHPELLLLRTRLQKIHDSISHFQPLTAKPPILDSSADIGAESTDDNQWLQQEHIPGLKKLRDTIKIDLDVLEKFLHDPESAKLPPLSTNAPYLVAVWNEVLCAPLPVVSVFKGIPLIAVDTSVDPRKRVAQKPPGTKVDVVADNGRRWIRVNTVKNARMLAEFREIDSYLTESDDDSDGNSEDGQPTLAQKEFDNSILRMGRTLLVAAKANPVEGTTEIPRVTLRLTRLDPSLILENGEENDPRISQTLDCLRDMGIDVELGERGNIEIPSEKHHISPSPAPSTPLVPTARVNLDLSVLIALVSDLTHSPLPISVDEAHARFIPPQRYREWRQQKLANGTGKIKEKAKDYSCGAEGDTGEMSQDLAKHSRALTNQVLQEMGKGLLQEIHNRLITMSSSISTDQGSEYTFPKVEFWTSPEARDRCLRITSKIGGIHEKRRAHALFPSASSLLPEALLPSQAEESYWRGSRYPQGYIPLLPIHLYPSSTPDGSPLPPPLHVDDQQLPPFFKSLGKTCKDILAQETVPHPRSLADDLVKGDEQGEVQRATVTKANPRLTAHTVQSMLWGAELGWTTLTANKTSVKAILREIKAAKIAGRLDGQSGSGAVSGLGDSKAEVAAAAVEDDKVAVWIVDPRSLAEGMRADSEV